MFVEQMLMRTRERLAVIDAGALLKQAAEMMATPHTDLVVVCDGECMVGVVTKTDIVRQIGGCLGAGCIARVDTIMTRDVASCRPGDSLLDVWLMMKERGLQRIPVVDAGCKPIGIVYTRDALQNLLEASEIEEGQLRDYISGVGYR